MKKRWISLFLSLCILCSLVSSLAFTASAADDDGVCGEKVTWTLGGSVLTIQGDGVMYDYSEDNPAPWSYAADRIKTVNISGYMYRIGDYAFSGLSALTTVNLVDISASIGESAFMNCTALTEITIPGKFLAIGNKAFAGCTELTSFTWETHPENPDFMPSLHSYVFMGCSKLENVSLPPMIRRVGSCTFWGCTALEYIHIPGSVETVSSNLFFNCTSLKSVSLGSGIKTISSNAFAYCESLTSVYLPDTVESIQEEAFTNCTSLTALAIPAEVKTVSRYAFRNCSNLKHLHFLGDMPIENAELTYVPRELVLCYTEGAEGWESCRNTTHKAEYHYMPGDMGDGVHTKKCDYCPYVVGEEHDFVDGYCSLCNGRDPAAPTERDIAFGYTVSFDSDLKMNYRIKLEDIAAVISNYTVEGAYLVVEKDQYFADGTTGVDTQTLTGSVIDSRLVFTLNDIQSVEMGSELRAVLHIFDTEGNEYCTPVDVISIKAYAQGFLEMLSYETNPEYVTMLIDLLNYGSAAQTYFGRRADVLANAGMDAYQQYATKELSEELNDQKTVVTTERTITAVDKISFSVNFNDKTEMNAKLTLADGYTAEDITCVKVLDAEGNVVETLTEGVLLEDGKVQFTYYGVKSVQLREMYYFVAYVGEEVASDSNGYSVEAYCKGCVDNGTEAMADMALKCMYYGDSAYAYFN